MRWLRHRLSNSTVPGLHTCSKGKLKSQLLRIYKQSHGSYVFLYFSSFLHPWLPLLMTTHSTWLQICSDCMKLYWILHFNVCSFFSFNHPFKQKCIKHTILAKLLSDSKMSQWSWKAHLNKPIISSYIFTWYIWYIYMIKNLSISICFKLCIHAIPNLYSWYYNILIY